MPKRTPTRPADSAFLRATRRHAMEALRTLRDIHTDPQKESAARVSAARTVIEYAEGKPASSDAPAVTNVVVHLDKTDQKL